MVSENLAVAPGICLLHFLCDYHIPHHSHFLSLYVSGFISGSTGPDLESNTWAKVVCPITIAIHV